MCAAQIGPGRKVKRRVALPLDLRKRGVSGEGKVALSAISSACELWMKQIMELIDIADDTVERERE